MIFTNLNITHATASDLPEITAIYNTTIASRLVTADLEEVTWQSKLSWFEAHNTTTRPLWVITYEGKMVAWLSFQSFYGRPAYNGTAEISVYIHPDYRAKGLGNYLLDYAIAEAPKLGLKTLLAFIFDHNLPSIQLFTKKGFTQWAHLPNIALMDDTERGLLILGLRVSS